MAGIQINDITTALTAWDDNSRFVVQSTDDTTKKMLMSVLRTISGRINQASTENWNYPNVKLMRSYSNSYRGRMISFMLGGDTEADTTDNNYHKITLQHGTSTAIDVANASDSTTYLRFYGPAKLAIGNTQGLEVTNSLGVGTSPSTTYKTYVSANISSGWAGLFFNDGASADRRGIAIQTGTDDNSGTNYMVDFYDGDGTAIGAISASGGTVTYGAFTGSHPIKSTVTEVGTLIKCDREVNPDPDRPMIAYYECTPSTNKKNKAVFGVYGGEYRYGDTEANGIAFCLGDGAILVTDQGGDIEIGDYLCASDEVGLAMKQDDDILHNYTIAKATEPVRWENEDKTGKAPKRLIGCTYHAS